MKKVFFGFIAFICTCIKLYAQDPVYSSLSNLNGLPSNTVYLLLQDSKGFVWIAHDKGLCRYDGKFFKKYKINSKQGRSLSNLIEANGEIWCQDFSGNFYHTQQDSLVQENKFKASGVYTSASKIDNVIYSVKQDSIRSFSTTNGIYASKAINVINYFCTGSFVYNNLLHFYNNYSLFSFDGKDTKLLFTTSQNAPPLFFLNRFGNNVVAFTKNTYPYCYLLSINKCTPVPILPANLFIQEIKIIDDELWVCTSTGTYCFDKDLKPKYNVQGFFKNYSITGVLKDKNGAYWFSTINNGIIQVANINTRLYTYNDKAITTLTKYNNNILAGTGNNALLNFNTIDNSFSKIYQEPSNHEVVHVYVDDKSNNIFYCSNKLFIIKNGIKISEYELSAKAITATENGYNAFAYASGLGYINTGNIKPENAYLPFYKKENVYTTNNILKLQNVQDRARWVLYSKPRKTLYAALSNGLQYFFNNTIGQIQMNGKNVYATQLIEDSTGIYIATFNEGLLQLQPNNTAKSIFKDSLNTTIYKICKQENWIWMIGDECLIKYNTQTNNFKKYTSANGLPKAELKDIVLLNNSIYIATSIGLIEFYEPDEQKILPPSIAINQFLVNNVPYNWNKTLHLSHLQNNISVWFSLLSYTAQDAYLLKYSINNQAWQSLESSSRELNLPSLAPGTYNIQLVAVSFDGTKASQPVNFSFSIANPFYKQWWFIASIILLACSLVYLFFNLRLKNAKKNAHLLAQKIQLEKQLQQSMMASIKSQMNPHFIFNALNTIQSYIYTNDKENASEYLGKFSELTRMILDMSNKEIVSLADEIKSLKLYLELESQRFEDKLTYNLMVDGTIITETTQIPSMLIQPYVENAIKHGLLHSKNSWLLQLHFIKTTNGITVEIDDNGIGRDKSYDLNRNRKHNSFATAANEKRLQILNEGLDQNISLNIIDKKDVYGNAIGTKVIIHIPILKRVSSIL